MFLRSHQIFWRLLAPHLSESSGIKVLVGSVKKELIEILLSNGRLEWNSQATTTTFSKYTDEQRTIVASSDVVLWGDIASEFADRIIEIIYSVKERKPLYLWVYLESDDKEAEVKKLVFSSEEGHFLLEKIHGTHYFELRLRKEIWVFPWRKVAFSSREKEVEGEIVSNFPRQVKDAVYSVLWDAYTGCDIIDDIFQFQAEEWFTPRGVFLNFFEILDKVKETDR